MSLSNVPPPIGAGTAAASTNDDDDGGDDGGPPFLAEMFINSTDTLRHGQVVQKLHDGWNDRPPLFKPRVPPRRAAAVAFLWGGNRSKEVEEATNAAEAGREDPNLLKGVSVYRRRACVPSRYVGRFCSTPI